MLLKYLRCNEWIGTFSNLDGAGIPGDGRCLFRSVVHGACLRSGKPSPSESLEKELADELRAKVQINSIFIVLNIGNCYFILACFNSIQLYSLCCMNS